MSTHRLSLLFGRRSRPSRLFWSLCAGAVFSLLLTTSAYAEDPTISLPEGWTQVSSTSTLSAIHSESLARVDAFQTKLPQKALPAYQSNLKRRLVKEGFQAGKRETLSVQGVATTKTRYTRKVQDTNFGLIVFETYKDGILWNVSALVPLDASSAALEADAVAILQKLL